MMGDGTKENKRTRNIMVMEQKPGLMETSMKGKSRSGKETVMERTHGLMVESM